MQMLGKRVYIKAEDPSVTESGIITDTTGKERPDRGEVIMVGDKVDEIEVGDRVIFDKNVAKKTNIEGKDLLWIREDSIFMKY